MNFKDLINWIVNIFSKKDIGPVSVLPPPIPKPIVLTSREQLYETAKACLGKEVSPRDLASDEFGCVESLDEVYHKTFGTYINGTKNKITLSTYDAYIILKNSPEFKLVQEAWFGDIIVSPTGLGNGKLANGHIGLVGKYGILSNNSYNGLWEENYTLETWVNRYRKIGGFPIYFFRRISS